MVDQDLFDEHEKQYELLLLQLFLLCKVVNNNEGEQSAVSELLNIPHSLHRLLVNLRDLMEPR